VLVIGNNKTLRRQNMRPKITTIVLQDVGYEQAITGLALSYNLDSFERAEEVAKTLAFKDGGHNKFLESIFMWIMVKAPRYWWQEADTFRLSTKQSESTMHTLVKQLRDCHDLDEMVAWASESFECAELLQSAQIIQMWELAKEDGNLLKLKSILPEGFLQSRLWCMSYKTMRNIILQRRDHKLPHWQIFINDVLSQCDRPELLPTQENK
jgi:hypothetical protein